MTGKDTPPITYRDKDGNMHTLTTRAAIDRFFENRDPNDWDIV